MTSPGASGRSGLSRNPAGAVNVPEVPDGLTTVFYHERAAQNSDITGHSFSEALRDTTAPT